jgi:hypothetical protein
VQLLQHKSAFDPPLFSAFSATEPSIPQFFRDRALSLLLASTLTGADDGCAWLILASAAVGSGNLAAALEHLANAHQLDMTEACALSNRSIVLQLKGDHAEAFEAVKEAITLRCGAVNSVPHEFSTIPTNGIVFSVFCLIFVIQPLCASALQQSLRSLPQHEEV